MTGGYAGVDFELCKILYAQNATFYILGRFSPKLRKAIVQIKGGSPRSSDCVEFLCLNLSDLSIIRPAVQSFHAQQQRFNVLVNNVGVRLFFHDSFPNSQNRSNEMLSLCLSSTYVSLDVMYPPEGSTSAQGHDLYIGGN